MLKKIDMGNYPRLKHFQYFSGLSNPYLSLTVNVDVTKLCNFCRSRKWSFYISFMHAVALAADGVPQLRQRISEGGIVEYDQCPTSHTELLDNGTYCYCTLKHHMDLHQYIRYAEKTRAEYRKKASIDEEENIESMFFVSSLPWIHYTGLSQPYGQDSNPRFVWGKYEEDSQGRLMMPLTVQVHHGIVDGIHLAQFFSLLEIEIEGICCCPEL